MPYSPHLCPILHIVPYSPHLFQTSIKPCSKCQFSNSNEVVTWSYGLKRAFRMTITCIYFVARMYLHSLILKSF